jgi:hypothetical protein
MVKNTRIPQKNLSAFQGKVSLHTLIGEWGWHNIFCNVILDIGERNNDSLARADCARQLYRFRNRGKLLRNNPELRVDGA